MEPQPQAGMDTLDLRDYLEVLRRRWIVVALVTVVVVATAMAFTFQQTPRYEARTEFVVGSLFDPTGTTSASDALVRELFGQGQLETQTAAIESVPVAERVIQDLGLDQTPQDVLEQIDASLTEEQVLVVRAESTDPEAAAALSSAFVDAYLNLRNEEALNSVLDASESLQERKTTAQERLDEIDDQLAGLPPESSQRSELEREQAQLTNQISQIDAQLAQLDVADTAVSAGGQILRPAVVPDEPFAPQPLRTGVLALVLGLMLGVGLAFLRDHLDDRIQGETDITRITGRPMLAAVPSWRGKESKDDRRLASLVDPSSPTAESYRTIRTNVRFLDLRGEKHRSLLVTSPVAAEGKSTTAANLAVTIAKMGQRVALVDADLRRPTIAQAFGIQSEPGLSDLLIGEVDIARALRDVGVDNLRVLPSGHIPPNPSEVLASRAMIELIGELESIADIVVYDSPPLLAVSDALELAGHLGGPIVVIQQGTTGRGALRAATQQLHNLRIEPAGVVLNNVAASDRYYGYYYAEYESEAPTRDTATQPGRGEDADGRPAARDNGRPWSRGRGRRGGAGDRGAGASAGTEWTSSSPSRGPF